MEYFKLGGVLHSLCIFLMFVCPTKQQLGGFVREVSQNYNEKLNSHIEQQILSYHNQELAYKAYSAVFARSDVDLPGFKKLFEKLERRAHKSAINMISHINSRGGIVHFPVLQLNDACSYIENVHKRAEITDRAQPYLCYFQSLKPDPYTARKKKDKKKTTSRWSWFTGEESKNDKEPSEDKEWLSVPGLHGVEDAVAMEKSINDGLLQLITQAKFHRDPQTRHHLEEYLGDQVDIIKTLSDLVTRLRQYGQDDYPLGEYLIDRELDS